MRIELEGTSEEVGRMLRALAGHHSFEAFQEVNEGRGVPLSSTAPEPTKCPRIFEELVEEWAEGFDPTGTAHWESNDPTKPDKGEKLRAVSLDRKAGRVLTWIEAKGGLTRAVNEILGDKKLARLVAVNIAQVGSVLFHDISLLLEHFDPFEDE